MSAKKQDLPLSPDSAVALSPTGALEGQLERFILEVNHLNTFLTQSVSSFKDFQDFSDRLTNLENRLSSLEAQTSGRELVNSRFESEVQGTRTGVSDAAQGETRGVVSEVDALLYREKEGDQDIFTRNLLAKLSPELTNALSVANCVTVFQLASFYKLKELSDAAQDVIGKNVKEILQVPVGKTSVSRGASPAGGSGSDEQGELSVSPCSTTALSPVCALDNKLDQLISEVNHLNAFKGNVVYSNASFEKQFKLFEERFQSIENCLEQHNMKLEGHDNRLEGLGSMLEVQNSKLEDKVLEPISQSTFSVERYTRLMVRHLATLVDFTFRREEPTVDEAVELLPSVHHLGMSTLVRKMATLLLNALTLSNCVVIFQLASRLQLEALQTASHDIICKNFIHVSRTCAAFCKLYPVELRLIVFSNSVHAAEEHVFEAIVLWIRADLPRRQNLISELLPAVRVNRCTLRFLKQTLDHFLVQDQQVFRKSAKERIKRGLSQDCYSAKNMPRAGSRDLFFVMGGFYGVHSVETLDPAVGSWVSHKIPDPPSQRTWIGNVGRKILVLEWDKGRFRSFDIVTRKWTKLCSLRQTRWGLTVTGSGDHVYVLGGKERHSRRCDRYDVRTDKWEEIASMKDTRENAAAVCHAEKVYCSGGTMNTWEVPWYQSKSLAALASLEVLHPQGNGQWSYLPRMRVERAYHCLVSSGQFLWAIAGMDNCTWISYVERYDVEGRQWNHVQPLNVPRHCFSTSILGGRIYVIGGLTTGYTPALTVEAYDEEKNQWSPVALLREGRNSHGSCVICDLSYDDADSYAVPIK